jgi:lipopolysaccharide transport system ATP-binding protein
MKPVIVVSGIGKTFRRYHADHAATIQEFVARGFRRGTVERFWGLRDISFTIEAGRTVGIIGSNGSGKSTLLRLIGGVGHPDTGRIEVHGRLGALLDLSAGFNPDLTGRENAMLAGILDGLTRKQVLQRLDSIVAFAEIEDAIDNPLRTYSSGMRMRLAFSVAVHTDPDILLVDEVLSVGDVRFQRKCLDRIMEIKRSGCSILLVSHVGQTVTGLCDEVIWLNRGELMAQGETAEIVRQYFAHMAKNERDAKRSSAPAPESSTGEPSLPVPRVTTEESRRMGSFELTLERIVVRNAAGRPVTVATPGESLEIEIFFEATRPLTALFGARITRENGAVCYTVDAEDSPVRLAEIQGTGSVRLLVERLDLKPGRYLVDASCYAPSWEYAYDCRYGLGRFEIETTVPTAGEVLISAHRWELRSWT